GVLRFPPGARPARPQRLGRQGHIQSRVMALSVNPFAVTAADAETLRNARRAIAAPGGPHDRLVKRLSRLLPAGIGAIAALLILVPFSPRNEVSFLLDRNKVAIAPDRLRVENAMYRGQ